MEEVAAYFGCSAATLRRKLDAENASFRNLLEEVRLSYGLGMLQESNWTITRVAQAVGYDSASRFSERFALRFGLSPTELRLTRQAALLSISD
jgi:AraC-like DNA-binding protein